MKPAAIPAIHRPEKFSGRIFVAEHKQKTFIAQAARYQDDSRANRPENVEVSALLHFQDDASS